MWQITWGWTTTQGGSQRSRAHFHLLSFIFRCFRNLNFVDVMQRCNFSVFEMQVTLLSRPADLWSASVITKGFVTAKYMNIMCVCVCVFVMAVSTLSRSYMVPLYTAPNYSSTWSKVTALIRTLCTVHTDWLYVHYVIFVYFGYNWVMASVVMSQECTLKLIESVTQTNPVVFSWALGISNKFQIVLLSVFSRSEGPATAPVTAEGIWGAVLESVQYTVIINSFQSVIDQDSMDTSRTNWKIFVIYCDSTGSIWA